MFSFHKPKVYRSTQGCCICKAKSSSSRFTDSKKYEHDFIECFQLETPRQGEICNACVLLVKRFKRLPPDSDRNWGHVVDARVGPGLKSMTKFKKRKEELAQQHQGAPLNDNGLISNINNNNNNNTNNSGGHQPSGRATSSVSLVSEKFSKIFRKHKAPKAKPIVAITVTDNHAFSDDMNNSPAHAIDYDDDHHKNAVSNLFCHERLDDIVSLQSRPTFKRIPRKSIRAPIKNYRRTINDTLFTEEAWTKVQTTCCGSMYENGSIGALLFNTVHPNGTCPTCLASTVQPVLPATTITAKIVAAPLSAVTTSTVTDTRAISVSTLPSGRLYPNSGSISATGTRTIKINTNGMVLVQKRGEVNASSSLGKIITIKPTKSPLGINATAVLPKEMMQIFNKNTMIEATNGHKFNDNSSDSGYDEMLHEPNAIKFANNPMRPLVLPSGLKLHVQSHNNMSNVAKAQDQVLLAAPASKLQRQLPMLATSSPGSQVKSTSIVVPAASQMGYLSQNKVIKIKVGQP